MVWRINDGSLARIGIDPWTKGGGRHLLSRDFIQYLHFHEIRVISHIVDPENTGIFSQAWKFARLLDLPPRWHQEWHDYI